MDNLEQTIHEVVLHIAREKCLALAYVQNEQRLTTDLELDSLDIARLVAVLELKLGADPFAKLVGITDVRTVGDLCGAYRKALTAGDEADVAPSFTAEVERAEARRRIQARERSGPQS